MARKKITPRRASPAPTLHENSPRTRAQTKTVQQSGQANSSKQVTKGSGKRFAPAAPAAATTRKKKQKPCNKTAGGTNKLQHESLWRFYDDLLKNVPAEALAEINTQILRVIHKHLAKK